jgi:XTP/dITP diphosphohydrolase
LLQTLQGGGGFGYDPLFVPDGQSQSFAEISADIKNTISHRAIALKAAIDAWHGCLRDEFPAWPA